MRRRDKAPEEPGSSRTIGPGPGGSGCGLGSGGGMGRGSGLESGSGIGIASYDSSNIQSTILL